MRPFLALRSGRSIRPRLDRTRLAEPSLDRKNRGKEVSRHPERVIDGGRVEINVCVKTPLLFHQCGNTLGHFNPLRFAQLPAQFDSDAAKMRRTRVQDFVDPMADAHDLFLFGQHLFHVSIDPIDRTDLLQHVDYPFVRPAVKRAFQGRDRRGYG